MRHLHKGLCVGVCTIHEFKIFTGSLQLPLSGWLVTWLNRAGLWLTETAVDKSKFLAQRWHTLLVDLSLFASLTRKFSIVVEIKT